MLRANRLNERIVRIKDGWVILSANMKKAGVVGRALVVLDYQPDAALTKEVQFVCVKSEERVKVRLSNPRVAEGEQQYQLYEAIDNFCMDFQSVGNRKDCPCDYWLVPGNTEIVDL